MTSIVNIEPIEEEFVWTYDGKGYQVVMEKPKNICDCPWSLFADIKKKYF